ncbi:MAG: hypothetical protein MI923_28335 [Phycisphaerales bacterium]|nr:hypothetical protein [Phycisphaerales bacterium]
MNERERQWWYKGQSPDVLQQFYVALWTEFLRLKGDDSDKDEPGEAKKDRAAARTIQSQIEDLLGDLANREWWTKNPSDLLQQGAMSWRAAYTAERLLVNLYDDSTANVELVRRLAEARNIVHSDRLTAYGAERDKLDSLPQKQALLNRLIDDLQWRYTVRVEIRLLGIAARRKTSAILALGVLLFTATLVMWISSTSSMLLDLAVASSAGFLAAAFSAMISVNRRLLQCTLEEAKLLKRWIYIIVRALIGVVAAAILFFFLQSGLFVAPILPEFRCGVSTWELGSRVKYVVSRYYNDVGDGVVSRATGDFVSGFVNDHTVANEFVESEALKLAGLLQRQLPEKKAGTKSEDFPQAVVDECFAYYRMLPLKIDSKGLALVIVWSFVAGFSEQFVPSILRRRAEQSQAGQARPGGAAS